MADQIVGVDWRSIAYAVRQENIKLKSQLEVVVKERDKYKALVDIQNQTKEERKAERLKKQQEKQERLLTGLKSDGLPIARAADAIRSYDELRLILDELKYNTGRLGVRNWAMFQCGVCMGVRASDLVSLKWNWLLNPDGSFKERIPIVERKTSKFNNCLITEGMIQALSEYRDWLKEPIDMDGYVFAKTNGEMVQAKTISRILKDTGEALDLPIQLTSHSMRKSFATIVLCIHDGAMNDNAIRDLQGMLGHADTRITMRYINETSLRYDEARRAVSDFVLGKTDVNELVVAKQKTNNEIFEVLASVKKELGV